MPDSPRASLSRRVVTLPLRSTNWRSRRRARSCARRRSEPGEPLIGWVAREGFGWAIRMLDGWMGELRDRARALGSPDMEVYLATRDAMVREKERELAPGLRSAERLFDVLRGASKRT